MYELPKLRRFEWINLITVATRVGVLLKSFIPFLCFVPKLNIKQLSEEQ